MTSFHGFGFNDVITRALADEKYLDPTPIQGQTIPSVMADRDAIGIGIAQTGTGNTVSFALPILLRHASLTTRQSISSEVISHVR